MAEDTQSIYSSSSAQIKHEPTSSPMMHHHQHQEPLVTATASNPTSSSAISTPAAVRSTPIPPPDSAVSSSTWQPPVRPSSTLSYTSYTPSSTEGSPFPQLPVQQAIQPNPYNIHNTSVYPYATDQELQQQMGMTGMYANPAASGPPPVPNFNYHPYAQYPTFYYAQAPFVPAPGVGVGVGVGGGQAPPPLPTDPAAYYQHPPPYFRSQPPPPVAAAPIASSSSSSATSSSSASTSTSTSTTTSSTNHTFVPLNMPQQQKRPRRKYEEIERIYPCKFERCPKSYGTLNHLNAHVQMQKHGEKRRPEEFREVRRLWKLRKKEREEKKKREDALKKSKAEAEAQQAAQAAQAAAAQQAQVQLIPQLAMDAPRSTYEEYYQNSTFDAMTLNNLGNASTSQNPPSTATVLPASQGYDHTTGQFYRQ